MTFAGRLVAFYPTIHLILILTAILNICQEPSVSALAILGIVIYVLPPMSLRLQSLFIPIECGETDLSAPVYSAWWGSFQFQQLFLCCPALEGLLRLVPGLYSAWLRLWGSRIGRGVIWTPRVEVLDRSLLDIGHHVVIGHEAKLIGHYLGSAKEGQMTLKVGKIHIGSRCLIGGGVRIGPDVVIGERSTLKILADIYPGARIGAGCVIAERTIYKQMSVAVR